MENIIAAVKEQKDLSSKLSYAIGYAKGYKESVVYKKIFTVDEVIELLEEIRKGER